MSTFKIKIPPEQNNSLLFLVLSYPLHFKIHTIVNNMPKTLSFFSYL